MPSKGIFADELAEVLWPDSKGFKEYHTRAPVRSVSGATVNVLLRGSTAATPCSKLASCSPKEGDIALVLMTQGGGIVLGVIG